MENGDRLFAVVTGASTGIGFELAKCCAENGYDLLIAADEPLDRAAGVWNAADPGGCLPMHPRNC